MLIVDRIREQAKLKGIKMGYLAESLGLNPSYFSNVASGKTGISDNRIQVIAEILNVSPDSARHEFHYERFEERRKAKHLLYNWIEDRLSVPYGFLKDVQYGYEELTQEQIAKLAILLDTSVDYLMGDSDDPRIPSDDRTGVKIGVFGDVAAGIPIKQIDNFDPEDPDSWEEIDRWTAKSGLYFALKIKGDSMSPRILEGDVVIVRKQPMVESGQLAVVAINGDTATCKKVIWDEHGGMFLMSLNPSYPPKYFSADDINRKPVTILGKVVEFRAKTI